MARGAEVDDFMRTAKSLGLTAFNFWEWSHARKLGLWEIIKLFPFAETPPPIVDPPSSVQVTAAEYIRQVIYPWMVSEGFKGSPPNIV